MFFRRDELKDGRRVKVQYLKTKPGKYAVFESPDRFVRPTPLAKMKGTKTKQGRLEAAANAAKKAEEVARKGDPKEEERAHHEAKARKAKVKTPSQKAGKDENASTKTGKGKGGGRGAKGK